MEQTALLSYQALRAFMFKLGLVEYTNAAILLALLILALMVKGILSALLYRDLTEEEAFELMQDTDHFDTVARGRIRRF